MFLRSGRDTLGLVSSNSCSGSAVGCGLAAAAGHQRLRKRKSPVKGEDASPHRLRRKSPPQLPYKQHLALPPPEVVVSAQDGASNWDETSDEEKIGKLGFQLCPHLPRETAAAGWVKFVKNAKLCIKRYNNENQTDFVYKHSTDNGFERVEELGGSCYYHLNFLAKDHNGHCQLFFGEIKLRVQPKEEDVSCCCPISPSHPCGKSIRTMEEAWEHEFPVWGTAGMDRENCYSCRPLMRHPKEASYIAGHVADSRHYHMYQ